MLRPHCDTVLDCPPPLGCEQQPFREISILPSVQHGAVVSWLLGPNPWPTPLQFRLEINPSGADSAEDWYPVTSFQSDIAVATDLAPRTAGWYQLTHYRIAVLDAANQLHHSQAVPANQGRISGSQQRLLNEILRREHKRYRLKNSPSTPGYLLKIRYYGDRCRMCIDPDSGEPTMSHCSHCYGTGYMGGYHTPIPCFNADLGPGREDLKLYTEQGPEVAGAVHLLRYLNQPNVNSWDVWVDATTDDRYLIGSIEPIAVINSLKLVCHAAAARLPYSHPAYKVDVRGQ